jgi:GUN4-like/NACHT domain
MKNQSNSTFEEQFVELIIKLIPLAGTGAGVVGTFWALFVASDMLKGLLLAIVTLMLGYTTIVFKPLHKGTQRRLDEVGEWIERQADKVFKSLKLTFKSLKWKLKNCDQKYLELQGEFCREYYGIGVEDFAQPEGIFHVNLDEVFVPLNLDISMGHIGRDNAKQEEPWQIWDVLATADHRLSYRWISIVAEGGSGKTTLLRHVGHEFAQGRHRKHRSPKRLPFLLYLRKWRHEIAKNSSLSLPELMEKHVRSLRGGTSLVLPPDWAADLLQSGKALILFDGYDEVEKDQRRIVAEWIGKQIVAYSKAVFIVTSRPSGYDEFKIYSAKIPTTLRVRKFEKTERDIFIQKWYLIQEREFRRNKMTDAAKWDTEKNASDLINQIDASEELKTMAANPLQLNLIARVHRFSYGAPLPTQKTKLYDAIFALQLGARPLAKQVEMVMGAEQAKSVLQSVALTMLRENIVQIDRSQLLDWIREVLTIMDEDVKAEIFLSQVEKVAELMYKADSEEDFAFSHLSFRNELSALECHRLENWDEVAQHFGIDGWRETILMLSGKLKPKVLNQLIERAIAVKPEHVYLAYDCLVRYPEKKKIEPTWIEALQSSRYDRLARLMEAGLWEKADQETYRLMIQTCGKDFEDSFGEDDLREFPSLDLNRIDELWFTKSDGRFGFSVQKRIWENCGSPESDYKNNKEKWDAFWDEVGWRPEIGSFIYDQLKFSLTESPDGELPCWYGGGLCFGEGISFLAKQLSSSDTKYKTEP